MGKRNERFQPKPRVCPYCGETFTPGPHKFRTKWHDCDKALEARKKIDQENQRRYDREVRPTLKDQPKKNRKSGSSERHYWFLAPGAKMYPCQSRVSPDCWGESPNRFNCPPCLEKLTSNEESCLDLLGFSTLDPPNIIR